MTRIAYYRRIFSAYLGSSRSQLSFWHDVPTENPSYSLHELGPYYMDFAAKARYLGPFDKDGIPLLDYRGALGQQYNPIAIAQYGLGNCNLYLSTGAPELRQKMFAAALWLTNNLADNVFGVPVWMHQFDWEYRDRLIAPWFSGLAQGQGVSLLLRAWLITGEEQFKRAADRAFASLTMPIQKGGVLHLDSDGGTWIEEYIVNPPTHILNGFMWAMWGVYDYWVCTHDSSAFSLWQRCVATLESHIGSYDTGYWSLYEHAGTRLPMLASQFYHSLHITQLRIMERLTASATLARFADCWSAYRENAWARQRAFVQKAMFKLLYY